MKSRSLSRFCDDAPLVHTGMMRGIKVSETHWNNVKGSELPDSWVTDSVERISKVATLDALYREVDALGAAPGWMSYQPPILSGSASSAFVPMHWSYELNRAALDTAGRLFTDLPDADHGRRNLLLRNSVAGNEWMTTRTLTCAYQMVLPGEAAPSHRHSSHALRVIIDAEGLFGVVDGAKVPFESGDVVLTPGGCWHGHSVEGNAPAYWFDCLDVPLTHLLEQMSFEPHHPDGFEKITVAAVESPYRFSRASIARKLDQTSPDAKGLYGPRVQLPCPDMPGMQLMVERLEGGMATRPQRSTANRVFSVMEGAGESRIEDTTFNWKRGDVFVAPSGNKLSHHAETDSVIFEVSDESLMRFLRYYSFDILDD